MNDPSECMHTLAWIIHTVPVAYSMLFVSALEDGLLVMKNY